MPRKPTEQEQQNNSRNEYIPAYISKAPFYAQGLSDSDYLDHQRLTSTSQDTLDKAKWYERGQKSGPAATKYRKGACENCGAMTHKTKECLSRPRKQGAKWTGRDIQADERVEDIRLGWDAKRDRWNGYDPREYATVIKEHEEMEALRKSTSHKQSEGNTEDGGEADDGSEARYAEETDMGRGQSNATRQLRLREDTANYLLNLDLDSARYDPKTRSMDTAVQSLNKSADSVAEEGFVRPSTTSDDASAFERAQRYAWETQELPNPINNSAKLHLQANPTEGEVLLRKRLIEDSERKDIQRKALLEKYGDQTSVQKQHKGIASSTESYIEYDPATGKPKTQFATIKAKPKSKYPEDLLTNNHTSVWGSWWSNFQWGYACCHSMTKNSYCTGEQGKTAFEEAEGLRTGRKLIEDTEPVDQVPKESASREQSRTKEVNTDEAQMIYQEQNGEDIQERKEEAGADTTQASSISGRRSNKRAFNVLEHSAVEEELESYKRNKAAADDPMKSFGHLGGDGLLEHSSVPL